MKNAWFGRISLALAIGSTLTIFGCGDGGSASASTNKTTTDLTGEIQIDGSSTVYPITQALAETFMEANPGVRITVSFSGTGGGFKKFIAGEIDIANASRPIEQEEFDSLLAKKSEFVELPIAFDGLTVVVNPKNTWVDNLTVAELKTIWESGSKVMSWKDVRPTWPDKPIKLFGAGTDSGTFDYFTEAICGKKGNSRSDYTASEDDNQLVQGVAGEEGALGYFGFAYYEQNMDKLKVVPVDGGKGAITPSNDTVMDGTYQPLSRPLFLYVSKSAAEKPATKELLSFFFANASTIVKDALYIPLNDPEYASSKKILDESAFGTRFMGSASGTHISEVLSTPARK